MNIFWQKIKGILALQEHVDPQAAAESIKKSIHFKGPNVYILAFAIVIASIGLNVNSIPVIIGAMLISPLMGPIIGIGYGLGINDTDFIKKASKNLLVMVVVSLIASCLYFMLSPLELENPTELLARTNPTIYDVLIALFGGFAGIVEISKKEKGTVISGVAIATALMPPLCTAGYGLANLNWHYFVGALYLFCINSIFIAMATFIGVKYLKYPATHFNDPKKQKRVNIGIYIIITILVIPSIYSAYTVIKENNFNQTAKKFVNLNKNLPKSYIYDYQINHHNKPALLEISIGGEALSESEMEMLCLSAENLGLERDQIKINQNAALSQNGQVEKAMVESIFERNDQEIHKREMLISQMETELRNFRSKELPYGQMAKELAAQYPEITSFSLARGAATDPATLESKEQIIAVISTNTEISSENIEKLTHWLRVRLDFENVKVVQE